jgi:hypothetical protein
MGKAFLNDFQKQSKANFWKKFTFCRAEKFAEKFRQWECVVQKNYVSNVEDNIDYDVRFSTKN